MSDLRNKIYNLLRASEKYTKTDMVYLSKGGSWLTLGQIITSVSSFLLAIAFANLLPADTFGTYQFVLSVAGLLSLTSLNGMGTALTRTIAQGKNESPHPALKARICWGVLGALGCIGVASYYFIQGNNVLVLAFLAAAVFLPFIDSFDLYDAILQGKKRFDTSSKYIVASRLIALGIIAGTLFATNNLFYVLLAYFGTWTIVRLFFYFQITTPAEKNSKNAKETISYGKHLSVMQILSKIAGKIDSLLLWHFLGATALAAYYFAMSPIHQFGGVVKNIKILAFPKFSSASLQTLKETLPRKVGTLMLFLVPVTALYILLAPFLFKIFFPDYLSAVLPSQIASLTLVLWPKTFFGQALTAHAKKRELYLVNIIAPIGKMVLFVVFIPLFGIIGAVSAFVASEVLHFFVLFLLFKRAS